MRQRRELGAGRKGKAGQTRVMNGQELGAMRGGVDANWWACAWAWAWAWAEGRVDRQGARVTTSLDWLIRLIRLSEGCLGPWTQSGPRVDREWDKGHKGLVRPLKCPAMHHYHHHYSDHSSLRGTVLT